MAETLTQKDVDSLLKGEPPAEASPARAEAELYDFRRPRRIPKDRQHVLESIFGRFALSVQATLSSRLRLPADVFLTSVEQATFGEFVFSLANPCAAFVFDLGGASEGQGVLDLGTSLALLVVDRLFGGTSEGPQPARALTPLEQLALQGVVDRILAVLGEAWHEELPLAPRRQAFESTPELLNLANRGEHVIVANLDVRLGAATNPVVVALPLPALESFLTELPTRPRAGSHSSGEQSGARATVEAVLRATRQVVSVRFPDFTLRLTEIAALQPGQVVATGLPADAPVYLFVCQRLRFVGTPGRVRHTLGVRITESVTDGAPVSSAPRGRVLT